ncbi:MAG: homocysteine S-methyltransferase family protein [Lachnospiraceae bacterium]|nr:homocysteine S-methyltransferase family protein [Lachnospiraceae bacterium]
MDIREYIKNNNLYLDGGMGTLLQEKGLMPGELPERWNISHPDIIKGIHKAYYDAGSNVVSANTFGANPFKYSDEELESLIGAGIKLVKEAAKESINTAPKFVALDIGPLGKLLKPYGELEFETAVEYFKKIALAGAKFSPDLVLIETMNDSYETKAALLGVKEACDLPVFVSNAYGEDGKLMTGAEPAAMVAMLEGMHADAIGVNCSVGPDKLGGVIEEYLKYSSLPVLMKPNAGLPRTEGGKTVYDIGPDRFSDLMKEFLEKGVSIVGGCCGTTPEFINKTFIKTKSINHKPVSGKSFTMISSYTHAVLFDKKTILIGERINPTGKKRFKQALVEKDMGYILNEGLSQAEKGAEVLDVNVGLPEIDEVAMLVDTIKELQSVSDLPLQIDTSNPLAMEKALRVYNGKPLINSVNGKEENMKEIFPLVKKYGGCVIALTLNEGGIPKTAAERVEIAKHIAETAAKYGIDKKDIIFDTLAMTISADKDAALATLESLKTLKELGFKTSLGVSNISFGLPRRELVTAAFFTLAMENGLSAAIMNPYSSEMMTAYNTFNALKGLDENCSDYISFATEKLPVYEEEAAGKKGLVKGEQKAQSGKDSVDKPKAENGDGGESGLKRAIVKGLKGEAGDLCKQLLQTREPLSIVNDEVIPALDVVGTAFEKKEMFLPQLLMAAEAANSAFEKIKEKMTDTGAKTESKGDFVIATVKGDIHDIGKNIVKLLLENYGFTVHDLGKDVPPEDIVAETIRTHAPLVGLSALMTTTVPSMEETIKQLREKAPWAKVLVGGAVLTKEYADMIGADAYGKDAMQTVRISLAYMEELNRGVNK